ncbi:MAG: ABC transporter ATP-binding protein [Chloroflexota bacterium]|nr:ABC transporter ATP-binding protein [Chloroflexota bacterium]
MLNGLATIDTPIIRATGLQKRYHIGSVIVEALRGVDVTVERGEIVAIMGPSGCGKTTLLHCLSGLDDFDAGEVLLAGTLLKRMSDDQKAEFRARTTGFVFQAYNLLPVLTAVENVELPLLLAGVRGREARERARAVLDAVGLSAQTGHRPSELSGGQQQRVAIARALVNDPAVVWADEPTGNLDSESAEDILDLLVALNATKQQTFVLVTHAPQVAERAHRILRMRDGRIVREERPSPPTRLVPEAGTAG